MCVSSQMNLEFFLVVVPWESDLQTWLALVASRGKSFTEHSHTCESANSLEWGCLWAESFRCFPPSPQPLTHRLSLTATAKLPSLALTHAFYVRTGVTVSAQQHCCHQGIYKGTLSPLLLAAGLVFCPVFLQLREVEL